MITVKGYLLAAGQGTTRRLRKATRNLCAAVSRADKTLLRCEARRCFMHAHAGPETHEHDHDDHHPEGEWKLQLVASGVCLVCALAGWWLTKAHASLATGLFAAAYLAGAWFTVQEVWEKLHEREIDVHFL